METSVVILTYVGTVLIAIEFVRKMTNLQALIGMAIGWPAVRYFSEDGMIILKNDMEKHWILVLWRLMLSAFFGLISTPIIIAFYIVWFVTLIMNSFHNWINRVYATGKSKFRFFLFMQIGLSLFAHKQLDFTKYQDVKDDQVYEVLEKSDIPILPILGIMIITVALVLFLVSV